MNSGEIYQALEEKHSDKLEWVFMREFCVGVGSSSRIDAWAFNCWPCNKHKRIAYEIKVTQQDFQREIDNPLKRQPALRISNEFYFVTPPGLLSPRQIPSDCGLMELQDGKSPLMGKELVKIIKAPWHENEPPTWLLVAMIARRLSKDGTLLERKEADKCQ